MVFWSIWTVSSSVPFQDQKLFTKCLFSYDLILILQLLEGIAFKSAAQINLHINSKKEKNGS